MVNSGSLDPKPDGGERPSASGPDASGRLPESVREQPDATLEELRRRLGVTCGTMAISRAPRKLGLACEKKILHAREPDSPQVQQNRQEFRDEMAAIGPRRPVFVDESGADTAMTRTRGRAPVGQRAPESVASGWQTLNRPALSPPAPSSTASS